MGSQHPGRGPGAGVLEGLGWPLQEAPLLSHPGWVGPGWTWGAVSPTLLVLHPVVALPPADLLLFPHFLQPEPQEVTSPTKIIHGSGCL